MFSFIKNASIKLKITAISMVGTVFFTMFVVGNYLYLAELTEKLDKVQNVNMELVSLANDLQIQLVDIDRFFEASLAGNDKESAEKALSLSGDSLQVINRIDELNPVLSKRREILKSSLEDYIKSAEQSVLAVIEEQFSDQQMANGFAKMVKNREAYESELRDFYGEINQDFNDTFSSLKREAESATEDQFLYGISLAIWVLAALIWLTATVVLAFNEVIKLSSKIADGNLDVEIGTEGSLELRKLFNALEAMRTQLKSQSKENDVRTQRQDRMAALNEALRGERSIKDLSDSLLHCLNQQLGSLVGALYMVDGDKLVMKSSYAFTFRKGESHQFKLGESMVGQAAMEQNLFVVRDLPDDYAPVSSGLGSARPKEVLVTPLLLNGKLLAVLELMSFSGFDDESIKFMERACDAIAIALNSAMSRVQLNQALEQTRMQAEAMEHQQEELRATNEELEEQTSILRSSEENLQQQQEELRVMNEELEERNRLLDRQKDEIEKSNSDLEKSRQEIEAKAEQLELSGRYKTEFLSTMSHELRTPLNSILILSQGLVDNKRQNLDDKQVEHAKVINSSGRDLLMLINDILDLSKVEEGKLELLDDNLSLQDLTSKLMGQFETQAHNKGIEFKVNIDPSLPSTIVVDEHRLSQILRNFISNALKFTDQGTVSVDVTLPDCPVNLLGQTLSTDDVVCFRVTDSGIGIPEDKLGLIFEAFQQVDGTISRKYGGTGLGLTISRKLAEIMGGTVTVTSEGENKGSSFTLFLPKKLPKKLPESSSPEVVETEIVENTLPDLEQLAAQTQVPALREVGAAQGGSILIVEDDPGFSGVLHNLAEEFGFSAHCAHSAAQARQYLTDHVPGSIILDLGLPDAPGEQILDELKSNDRTKNIPVHVISGRANVDVAKLHGAEEFIEKPFGRARLDQLFNDINSEIKMVSSGQRVLIVEDDAAQREQLQTSFESEQVPCDVAATGEQALEYLANERYGTIVVDLHLPDTEGLSLLKSLHDATSAEVPIIVYTARDIDKKQDAELRKYARRIVLKTDQSISRLLSETTLFLHWLQDKDEKIPKPEEMKTYEQADLDAHQGKRLLLVDDDIRNLYSLSAVLEECGFEIATASTGIEAIEVLNSEQHFDLVLMDIMMPEMDGLQATEQLRKDPRHKNLPIIALTAKAMRDDRARCIAAGANDYMSKPVDPGKLKAIVGMWLRQA